MELSPKQQVTERINKANRVLVLTHKNPDGDAVGSSLAVLLVLKNLGKEVMAVCNDAVPDVLNFLPEASSIQNNFATSQDFIISLDVSKTQADKIMYKVKNGKLNIIITPKSGQFNKEMVSFSDGKFSFDLIIVLDSPDIERVGSPYEKNADVFYQTPIINIDHHASNDYFGQVNLVDITATSTAEILVSIFESLQGEKSPFTPQVATALLTGIITDTGCFQNANTTPKALTVAAQLVAAGANREEIIKRIYKTRPLSTLRLWGRALSNIHHEKGDRFVWSSISKKDYLEVEAKEDEIGGVIDELLKTVSGVDFVLLFSERGNELHGSLRAVNNGIDVSKIAKIFNGGGHPLAAAFQIKNTSLEESTQAVIQRIRERRREINGENINKGK